MSAFERPLKMTSHIVPYPIILVLLLYFNRLLHLLGQLSLAFLRGRFLRLPALAGVKLDMSLLPTGRMGKERELRLWNKSRPSYRGKRCIKITPARCEAPWRLVRYCIVAASAISIKHRSGACLSGVINSKWLTRGHHRRGQAKTICRQKVRPYPAWLALQFIEELVMVWPVTL